MKKLRSITVGVVLGAALLVPAGVATAAANPSGTGRPNQSCEDVGPTPGPADGWRPMPAEHFASRVGRDAIAVVVDHPTIPGRVVASGAATVSTRLPTPMNPTGAYGYIQWVATDDDFRGRGYARAAMTTIL